MYVPAGSGGEQGTGPASGKKRGKGTIGGGKDDVDLGGAETLFVIPMSRAHVQLAPFFSVLEALVRQPSQLMRNTVQMYSLPHRLLLIFASFNIDTLYQISFLKYII